VIAGEASNFEPAPGDANPQIMELAKKGKGEGLQQDLIMVLMPRNVLLFMGMVRGEIKINSSTGFPEFGGLGYGIRRALGRSKEGAKKWEGKINSTLRIGATIAGAVIGMPYGLFGKWGS